MSSSLPSNFFPLNTFSPPSHLTILTSPHLFTYTNHHQVPATINRITTLVDPTLVLYPLNLVEAFLLPLQGFFNAVIYIAISTDACNYLRAHCRRVFRQIFINPWKHLFGLPITIPMNNIPPVIPGAPIPRSRKGKNKPYPYGSDDIELQRPRKAVVKPIQPEEIEQYHRLHKALNISPEPGATPSISAMEEYERLHKMHTISSQQGSTAASSSN
jgi:hypothetical protein